MKNLFCTLLTTLCLFTTHSCSNAQVAKKPGNKLISKAEKIKEIVSLYAEYGGFNGTVLVGHEGKVIYKDAFGYANMQWDIPNTVNNKFQIASITKQFTAMLVMQMVADDKLALHEPISTYLPDYPAENGKQITIHHLLTHTAGLNRGVDADEKKKKKPEEMVEQFASAPLQFTPGAQFAYSNNGYTLLGYILETVTGQTYEEQLQEKIFEPLAMHNSGFFRHNKIQKNMANGYNKGFGEYFNASASDESTAYAAGAIYSTVEDMWLWNQAIQSNKLLPKEFGDLFFTKYIEDGESRHVGHYGYGWELIDKPIGNTAKKVATVGHSGSIDGFRSLYTSIPETNSAIIFLNNTNRSFLTSMTTAITGILYDESYDFPFKPLAMFMTRTIKKEGIDKGIQFYKDHKNNREYQVSEQELIVEGYRLLHAGNAADAAKVFKLAIEVWPDRDNPYDSYAEALMTLGNKEEAEINYKKSLELNPRNGNAVKMLQKMGIYYTTDIIATDLDWGQELFPIPLQFAPEIKLKGTEDARFAKGWRDVDSDEFWTYTFTWKVEYEGDITVTQLEEYMRQYYHGLLSNVNKQKDFELPATIASFSQETDGSFKGQVTAHDSFITTELITLHIKAIQEKCANNGKSIFLFTISPKPFTHKIWNVFDAVTIDTNACKN